MAGPMRRRPNRSSRRIVPWPAEALRRGYTPRNSVLRGTRSGRSDRRPSLQVINYRWSGTSAPIFKTGGATYLLSTFARGNGEDQRRGAETIIYKIAFKLVFAVTSTQLKYVSRGMCVIWLVYDAQPTGTKPEPKDIFDYDTGLSQSPMTWSVQRALCNRFVVKRRWKFELSVNGVSAAEDFSDNRVSGKTIPYSRRGFDKFCKRLATRTEWKNTEGGDIGDIQKGALYVIAAPGNAMEFQAIGNIRVYFKSVGLQ
uniref:Capsid protein n=1 Tax=Sugarcane white streak virus TaxID=1492296 RepID=A0A023T7Z7_9GEMI|nr:capsid protein [Sugarcane white streak virus]